MFYGTQYYIQKGAEITVPFSTVISKISFCDMQLSNKLKPEHVTIYLSQNPFSKQAKRQ